MASVQQWRDRISKGDTVFVVVTYAHDGDGNALTKKKPAKVERVVRGAAQLMVDGESSPRMVKFSELETEGGAGVGDGGDVVSAEEPAEEPAEDPGPRWCEECGSATGQVHAHDCTVPGVSRFVAPPEPDPVVAVVAVVPPPPAVSKPRLESDTSLTAAEHEAVDAAVGAGAPLDDLLSEAKAILDMRAPVVKRLEVQLSQLLAVRRGVNERVEKVERMLDQLNADATYGSPDDGTNDGTADWEMARPYDRERIKEYLAHIDACMGTGPCTWNEIRAFVIEQHPRVDTRLLGSALGVGKDRGMYDHDGRRGGLWSMIETRGES